MIQSFLNTIKSLKSLFEVNKPVDNKNLLDALPDTMNIEEYIDTLPDCSDADLL